MPFQIPFTFLFDFGAFVAIFMILTLSLNIKFGLTGIADFGLVLGVVVGAATVGAVSGRIAQWVLNVQPGEDFIANNTPILTEINATLKSNPLPGFEIMALTLVLALFTGALIGYLSSLPALRLRGDYLAMVLLAFGEAARLFGDRYDPLVGGALGVQVIDPFGFLGPLRFPAISLMIIAIAVVVFVYTRRIEISPLGRTLKAIRENDLSAATLGKDVIHLQMRTLTVGGAITALCGALYAFYSGDVTAITYIRQDWVFLPWLMIILGGRGNAIGAAIGTLAVIGLQDAIVLAKQPLAAYLPFDPTWLEYIALGLIMLVILTFRPKGLFPERPGTTVDMKHVLSFLRNKESKPSS